MSAVAEAVYQLTDAGVRVLSPADPRVVGQFGDFLFVASDTARTIKHVEGRHLAAIDASDFVWLVAPDGYIGQSAAMEIGYAIARQIPVYGADVPIDLTLRQWVAVVPSVSDALRRQSTPSRLEPQSLLLDPVTAIDATHDDLIIARRGLVGRPTLAQTCAAAIAARRMRRRLLIP